MRLASSRCYQRVRGQFRALRPGEGDQEGLVGAGAVDVGRVDGPEARLAEPGTAWQSGLPPAHGVALLIPAGSRSRSRSVTATTCLWYGPSVSGPAVRGIVRRLAVHPRSAPDGHGMILTGRCVDLEDTTYRVVFGRHGLLKSSGP